MTEETKNPILIDIPMPIETPRLRLERPRVGLGAAYAEAISETWEDLSQWMIWAKDKAECSADKYESLVREWEAKFIRREELYMPVFDKMTGRFVGSSGIHDINWQIPSMEIGYWIRKSEQRKGYAHEVTNALLVYAFNQLGAKRVQIAHAEGNIASEGVIRKAGFLHEGRFENSLLSGGDERLVAKHVYAMTSIDQVPSMDVRW